MATFNGSIMTTPFTSEGLQDGYGVPKLAALAGSNTNPIPHYALACYDNTNVRHYWSDTSISLTNAPVGFTYTVSTLVVLGKF